MTSNIFNKVSSLSSPVGTMGQKFLASGQNISMRLWENEKPEANREYSIREYETVGYVISGKAELNIDEQKITLETGDSWVVPKGAKHFYAILENFTAVEATYPPAEK